jgi:hypothetical protein
MERALEEMYLIAEAKCLEVVDSRLKAERVSSLENPLSIRIVFINRKQKKRYQINFTEMEIAILTKTVLQVIKIYQVLILEVRVIIIK